MKKFFKSIPERTLILILIFIFCFFSIYSYFLFQDNKELERKIEKRQNELGRIIALKKEYLEKKSQVEEKKEGKSLTLSSIEQIYSKNIKGGRIIVFKPMSQKTGKKIISRAIEMRIQGVVLQDTLSLIEDIEKTGFFIRKLQISLSQTSPNLLDIYIMISES